ncbi:sensor histidine kinase [Lachnotalea sp. AF33-28]|uniref:sensor histidine kinase n=1 Tax=Lachnotalea sp. AF33-28 TaxID=2292046 RepID=UPI000E4739C7|nr:sensor histidine kinase [Lachnotalea sp. AF33-28]RHP34059.1 sensor histidine kinase [Lachnotalea sp. AF33-28]
MSDKAVIFVLSLCAAALAGMLLYQRYAYKKGMAKKLNEMAAALESVLETGEDSRVLVFTDNRELIRLADRINLVLEDRRKVRADYRRMEISLKRMLSNISHDIKTPMTVILGYLEIMRLNTTENGGMLAKVEERAQRVMDLINEFFTLAKLEAGDMNIEPVRINVNESCRKNLLDFYELLTQQGFLVEAGIPETPIYVQGDEDALQRILFNLITNAVRYGAEGKYLGITLRADESSAYIDVTDRGRGIEPAFARTVFERLFTAEDSRSSQVQGNGLGLTIARNLARRLGGDITLRSEPGVETVFTVTLKRSPL